VPDEQPPDIRDEGRQQSRMTLIALWLLLALVLAIVMYLAFRACGVRLPLLGQLDWCKPVSFSYAPEADPLEMELARLEKRLNDVRQCPVAPNPEPQPEPQPEQAALEPCPEPQDRRVILVTDVSTSMESSINLPADLEQRYNQAIASNNMLGALVLRMQVEAVTGPSRIAVAKDARTRLAADTDPDITFDFYTFAQCGAPDYLGRFEPGERQALMRRIRSVGLGPSTALADAINGIAQRLSGEPDSGEDINIVLLSDGMDTCSGDPCAAARRLNASHPDIPINVVALSRSIGAVQCVADATGGAFYPASEAGNVIQSIREAAVQDLPDHCRDPESGS